MPTHRAPYPILIDSALVGILLPARALAQRTARTSATATAPGTPSPVNPALYSDPSATNMAFKSLRRRLIGPFRGGRVDALSGDPAKPVLVPPATAKTIS